jgi:6-phosphogluconolactonase (cycloisomerase 2 family)
MRNSSRNRLGWVHVALASVVTYSGAWVARGDGCDDAPNAVYALTNEATDNRLAVFARGDDGTLTPVGLVPTGGAGTGQNTHSQGGLAFGDDQRSLYAVNSGDNTITVFSITPTGPVPIQRIDSGGQLPVSLAVRDDLVYVLNAGSVAGGVDNIAGFRVGRGGFLLPLHDSSRPLSAAMTGPAQVGFSRDGEVLIVTERNTNLITTYQLDEDGRAGPPQPMASAGAVPFGFKVNRHGFLIVSEAAGGANGPSASSYRVDDEGTLAVISASVPTNGAAPCWIGVTEDGQHAYAVNAGSGTITGYAVGAHGALTRLSNNGGIFPTGGNGPTEVAALRNQLLYVLNRDSGGIGVFHIGADGTLVMIQNLQGVLPATTFANGLLVH